MFHCSCSIANFCFASLGNRAGFRERVIGNFENNNCPKSETIQTFNTFFFFLIFTTPKKQQLCLMISGSAFFFIMHLFCWVIKSRWFIGFFPLSKISKFIMMAHERQKQNTNLYHIFFYINIARKRQCTGFTNINWWPKHIHVIIIYFIFFPLQNICISKWQNLFVLLFNLFP